jgi:hypothetical protein
MSEHVDIERMLGHWFEEGPATMPDRVVDVVARRISISPQGHSWRLSGKSQVRRFIRYGAAAAAAISIAIVGYGLLVRTASIGGPGPTATPTSTTTPGPTAGPTQAPTPGLLDISNGGTFKTSDFGTPLQYTVPAGWQLQDESPSFLALGVTGPVAGQLQLLPVSILISSSDCSHGASGLAGMNKVLNNLTSDPALVVKNLGSFSIDGHRAVRIEVELTPTWTGTCLNTSTPAAPLLMDPFGIYDMITSGQRDAFVLIDIGGGTLLASMQAAPSALDAFAAEALPVIRSLKFEVNP